MKKKRLPPRHSYTQKPIVAVEVFVGDSIVVVVVVIVATAATAAAATAEEEEEEKAVNQLVKAVSIKTRTIPHVKKKTEKRTDIT